MAKPKSKIILELFESGKSIQEICNESNIKQNYVIAVLKKNNKLKQE